MIRHPAAEHISAYLSGDLGDRDAEPVRQHLDGCPACESVASDIRTQVGFLAELDRHEPPITLWSAIEGTLARGAEESRHRDVGFPWPDWRAWRGWILGPTMGAALVFGAVMWFRAGGGAPVIDQKMPSLADAPSILDQPASPPRDPLLIEAANELTRAARDYEQAAARLRAILEKEQTHWQPAQRARVAEWLVGLDEAVAHSRAVAERDPGDGAGAELLFAAYQKQIAFLAETVQRGAPSVGEGWK